MIVSQNVQTDFKTDILHQYILDIIILLTKELLNINFLNL